MAKKKSANVLGFVLLALIVVGLVLAVVGMFVGQVSMTTTVLGKSETKSYNLFDSDVWGVTEIGDKTVGVSNVFGIISFIVTLIGLAVLLLDCIAHYILGKDLKIIRFVGVALTFVGAVLVLVAGLVMASQCSEYLGGSLGDLASNTYAAGAGVWLGFIGGLVGAVGGGLALLKKFN